MLELIFVIVVIGVLSKFGVEFMAQAYRNFIFSNINNKLQAQSAAAVELIAKRLEYRIKSSVVARKTEISAPTPLRDASVSGSEWLILEWVGEDVDGLRGTNQPYWSGVLDLDDGSTSALALRSPGTNLATVASNIISLGGNGITDAAVHFVGGVDEPLGFAWLGLPVNRFERSIHPLTGGVANTLVGNFNDVDVYEHYKLAWSAYGIKHKDNNDLEFCYNYQPWRGETISDATCELIMQNVSSFRFRAVDSLLKIQVCVHSGGIVSGDSKDDAVTASGEYALCKEKTVF